MADVLSPEQRRLNMSRIKGRDTKPEMIVRRGLHGLGFRFRLQNSELPGKPDLTLPKYRTAIFVHGCFWHDHGCSLCKPVATRKEFWAKKLQGNKDRDNRAILRLQAEGWRVLVIWECAMRGVERQPREQVIEAGARFLTASQDKFEEIPSSGMHMLKS